MTFEELEQKVREIAHAEYKIDREMAKCLYVRSQEGVRWIEYKFAKGFDAEILKQFIERFEREHKDMLEPE